MAVRGLHVLLTIAVAAVGCTTGAAPSGSSLEGPSLAPSSIAPTEPAAPSPQASAHAIVGEWVGIHDCQRIVSMLEEAGLDEYITEQVNGNGLVPGVDAESDLLDPSAPCAEAVPRKHSHYFTADGSFGSRDFLGEQVDDGGWRIEEDDVLVINGTPFRFRIEGDELTLEPPEVALTDCGVPDCRFLATWVRMVAMPGTTWTRGRVTG